MNIKKTICAAALIGLNAISGHAATITWDGSAADGLWATPANWDLNRIPATDDVINIDSATVAVPEGTQNLSGSINLTGTAVLGVEPTSGQDVLRFRGGTTINVGSSATFGITTGGNADFFDFGGGAVVNLSAGATDATVAWETRNNQAVAYGFDLTPAGFTTINAARLKYDSQITNLTWDVDMTAYAGGAGTISLITFATNNGSTTVDSSTFDDGTVNLNVGSYAGSTLSWNDGTNTLELNVIPEPSSSLFLVCAMSGLLVRRSRRAQPRWSA